MTQHFRMDWLNTFPLKDVLTFIRAKNFDASITASDIAQEINHHMEAIMKGEQLTYGISERGTNVFVGIIKLVFEGDKVHFFYDVNVQFLDDWVQIEIFDYIFPFLKENFHIKEIWAKPNEINTSFSIYLHYGFTRKPLRVFHCKL